MTLLLILLVILLIVIFPIPLKIEIKYSNEDFILKLFKHTIFSSKNGVKNKYLKRFLKKKPIKINKNKDYKNHKKSRDKKKISFKKLYKNITSNKFKPLIKVKGFLTYGLDDAAYCALLYGLLSNLPGIFNFSLDKIFKVRGIIFDINPKFNTVTLSFGITSIFYFNLANIIYIFYLILKSREFKEVAPNQGRNI
jgi:hypothetical protein